jgi:hypothetical protein
MTINDAQILWRRPCLPFSVIRDVFGSSSARGTGGWSAGSRLLHGITGFLLDHFAERC